MHKLATWIILVLTLTVLQHLAEMEKKSTSVNVTFTVNASVLALLSLTARSNWLIHFQRFFFFNFS